jgi:membrane protein
MPFGSESAKQTIAGGPRTSAVPTKTEGAPGPDSPLDLESRDWKATLKRTAKEIQDDKITFIAAGMAFYFFLAVFPAIIAAVGFINLIDAGPLFMDSINQSIDRSMPGGAGEILQDAIANAREGPKRASLFAAIFGVAVALWSATSGMVALQTGLDFAYDVTAERKFVKKRLIALGLVLATGVLSSASASLFAQKGIIWSVAGWLVFLVCVITMFALFYYLGPNRQPPNWKWISPGGVVGTLIWIAASAGFGFYVANFGKYAETYGSLAGVVILIFWLYISSLAILVGGELNAALERQTAKIGDRA